MIGVRVRRARNVFKIGFFASERRQMDQDTPELYADEIPAAFLGTEQGIRRTVEKARTKEATR